jgi:hypothetical protein
MLAWLASEQAAHYAGYLVALAFICLGAGVFLSDHGGYH